MRKYHKKQCLELISSIEECHRQIAGLVKEQQIDAALALLVDCQQAAIEIGTVIDGSEGEGTKAVSLLEDYCEFVYAVHEDILRQSIPDRNLPASLNIRRTEKRAKQILSKVRNEIRAGISTQTEMLFLPYKASMWDSLESIWMSANEDPNCDAYVMPIPYFDKNKDGSLGTLHYEGDLYPDDVPIISESKYNLEGCHPDVIFIHNPYDNYNIVTSVHPKYYTDKLKEYTDCLVYVPYFATMGKMSEGQAFIPSYLNMIFP